MKHAALFASSLLDRDLDAPRSKFSTTRSSSISCSCGARATLRCCPWSILNGQRCTLNPGDCNCLSDGFRRHIRSKFEGLRCLAWAAAAAIHLEWRSSRLTFIISNLIRCHRTSRVTVWWSIIPSIVPAGCLAPAYKPIICVICVLYASMSGHTSEACASGCLL